jgi:hypothetical protein
VSATPNTYNCGVEAATGTNPTVAQWQPIFDEVSHGPAVWANDGPSVSTIHAGCNKPMPPLSIDAVFPCELLRAIAMNESGWTQFCKPTSPASQVGLSSRTIISFDCGYGIAQVTSGMHIGETPTFDRTRVAAEPTYNLATGALILAGKWRGTACVGDNQPTIVEDWYIATWAYNGLAAVNDPNNASYDAMRGVCDPSLGCPMRPYQERVWGWMENPPSATYWAPLAPAYPALTDFTYNASGQPLALPEPHCAGPTDCSTARPTHVSECLQPPQPDLGVVDASQPTDSDGGMGPGTPSGCACEVSGRPKARPALGMVCLWVLAAVGLRCLRCSRASNDAG